jgi:hypothetical protein
VVGLLGSVGAVGAVAAVVATSAFLAACAIVAVLPTAAGVKASAIALGRPVCDKAIRDARTIASLTIFLMFMFFPLYLISIK